jgi:hypothetical protein
MSNIVFQEDTVALSDEPKDRLRLIFLMMG